ncbi:MAG: hypothetical protein HY741_10895 [Chloroflexi bacterium]|nr:hypothetical protein [Chloroflexota bacterium]
MAGYNRKPSATSSIPTGVFLVGAIALLGIAAVGIWVLLAPETQDGVGPLFTVNQERLELGKQPFEQMVRAEFQIKNTGDRVLTLDSSTPVRALEGC